MNQFYTGLIFTGIAMIIASLLWIFADWRRSKLNLSAVDQKKQELQSIIEDADQMIQELNKLSDYIFSNVEEKSAMLNQTLSTIQIAMAKNPIIAEDKSSKPKDKFSVLKDNIEHLEETQDLSIENTDASEKETIRGENMVVSESNSQQINSDITYMQAQKLYEINKKPLDKAQKTQENQTSDKDYKISRKKMDMNQKHIKVINLSQSGLSDIEIAKHLNMGYGEVQLILEMHR